jgi:hypothetical protein
VEVLLNCLAKLEKVRVNISLLQVILLSFLFIYSQLNIYRYRYTVQWPFTNLMMTKDSDKIHSSRDWPYSPCGRSLNPGPAAIAMRGVEIAATDICHSVASVGLKTPSSSLIVM